MKALSLRQPWASLIAQGRKEYETRSWRTNYRGPLAIHAARGLTANERQRCAAWDVEAPPLGAIVAIAELVACLPTEAVAPSLGSDELRYGFYGPGRWAWRLDAVSALPEPLFCRGALGLWSPPPELGQYLQVR